MQLTLSNLQAQHFNTLLTLPLALGVDVTILRGWLSADATVRGRTVRVIAIHLESFFEPVQEAQAAEITSGPAASRPDRSARATRIARGNVLGRSSALLAAHLASRSRVSPTSPRAGTSMQAGYASFQFQGCSLALLLLSHWLARP